ncbi:MAG: hypothetical protein ACXVEM_04860 [Gaiellaceae bacterium]
MGAAAVVVGAAAGATAEMTERPGALALVEARPQALLIATARLVLASAGLAASIAAGVGRGPAAALFACGAVILLLSVYGGDRRRRSAMRFEDAGPVPSGAHVEPRGRALVRAAYPSTIGLTVLIAIALWPQPGLAALLAGILGGLGGMSIAGALRLGAWEHERRARILIEAGGAERIYEAPR